MSNPEFRLLPWEHRGLEAAPCVRLDARIEGRVRRFDVKTRKNRVYCHSTTTGGFGCSETSSEEIRTN